MISIEPQTSIILCHVPWENDYTNQMTFANATKQAEYFAGLSTRQIMGSDFTYQRKDGYITVGVNIESLRNYNYVYYTNVGFSNKIFYAFITDMKYISENSTRITIETDVFQTWQFDLTYHQCFVEREHVSDDTVGLHTVPENVDTGEYICNSVTNVGETDTINNSYMCVATTFIGPNMSSLTGNFGLIYNGIYSGTAYVFFKDLTIDRFIAYLDAEAKADAILTIFMVPKELVDSPFLNWDTVTETHGSDSFTFTFALNVETPIAKLISRDTLSLNTTLNGYTPKNNKLKCYPYNYLVLTNNSGNEVVYRYEDFIDNLPIFQTVGSVCPSCSIYTYPVNYKKIADSDIDPPAVLLPTAKSYEYGIAHGKYPICSWSSDVYINWLTQNSLNIAYQGTMGAISTGIGVGLVATGFGAIAGTGMILNGADKIASTIISGEQHAMIPPEAHGTNVGDVCFSSNNLNVVAKKMSVRSEYARIIDNYFEMFGYKICRLKVPTITGRPYWNYIKTVDCNVEGEIPEDDLLLIRKMFNNGVTLWHTADMYDYSKNNH